MQAMVREANRLKLSFPEVSDLLETHRSVEAWIDRANIAIRSRISLTEIKTLIQKGQEMPVDLSDFMEKLRARESLAEEWIQRFEEVVPRPNQTSTDNNIEPDTILLRWMQGMRAALNNGKYAVLHDIASEGNRIPVEVDIVKLLQLELDAKSWASKAKKWTPSPSDAENSSSKRGKLEDLRDHIEKAAQLREKLDLSASAKANWTLDGEDEIRAIVKSADEWFQKVRVFRDTLDAIFILSSHNLFSLSSISRTWTGIIVDLKDAVVCPLINFEQL
jgi:PLU-1-like protein